MKVTTEVIKKKVEHSLFEVTDVNGKKYKLVQKGIHEIRWNGGIYGPDYDYLYIRNSSDIIKSLLRSDDSVEMDCGTIINAPNIVSAKSISQSFEDVYYLKTKTKSLLFSDTYLKNITDDIKGVSNEI